MGTNAVIYARISPRATTTDETGVKTVKSDTIGGQFEDCEQLCTSHGWQIVGRYQDRLVSGAKIDRRGLEDAIAHACRTQAVLVCWDASRLTRSTSGGLMYRQVLLENGCRLWYVHGGEQVLDSAESQLVATIMDAVNEYMRLKMLVAIKAGVRRRMRSGKAMGAALPIGFRPASNGDLVRDPRDWRLAEKIAAWRRLCHSPTQIAQFLRRWRVRNRRGNFIWHQSQVKGWASTGEDLAVVTKMCQETGYDIDQAARNLLISRY